MKEYLILGLGNYSKKFEDTRHNIGLKFVKKLANSLSSDDWEEDKNTIYKEVHLESANILFVFTKSYMNDTGEHLKKYKGTKREVFLVSDDLNLEEGKTLLTDFNQKTTHNGIKSVIPVLDISAVFRIGVGRPSHMQVKNFVLSKPSLFGSLKLRKAYKRFYKSIFILARFGKEESKSYFSGRRS